MIKRAAVILAGVLAAIALMAAPAQAAPTCQAGLVCWFDQSNWQGPQYKIATGGFSTNTCYGMGVDPNTGINWNDIIDSVWWNGTVFPGTTHMNFYKNAGCTGTTVTTAWGDGHVDNQMQSCNESVTEWDGACGSSGISSWKFWY